MVDPVGNNPPRYPSIEALKADYQSHGPAILRGGNQVTIGGINYLIDLFNGIVSAPEPTQLSAPPSASDRRGHLRQMLQNFFKTDTQEHTQELYTIFFAQRLPGSRPRSTSEPMTENVSLLHAIQNRRHSLPEPLPLEFIRSVKTLGGVAYALNLMQQQGTTTHEAETALTQRAFEILQNDMHVTTTWDLAAIVAGLQVQEFEELKPQLHDYLCRMEASQQAAKITGPNPTKETLCNALAQHVGFQEQAGGIYIANAVNYIKTPFLMVGSPTPEQAVLCDVLGCQPHDLRVDINQTLNAGQLRAIHRVIHDASHQGLPERLAANEQANTLAQIMMEHNHPHQASILKQFASTVAKISSLTTANILGQLSHSDFTTLQSALAKYLASQQVTELTKTTKGFADFQNVLQQVEHYCFATGMPPALTIDLLTTGNAVTGAAPNDSQLGFAMELLNELRPTDQRSDPRVQQLQATVLKTAIADEMATQIEARVDALATSARSELETLSVQTGVTPGAMITEAKELATAIREITESAATTTTATSTSTQL